MAKISAHGTVIGTVYFMTTAKRYMSDGTVLKNLGIGWKIHGRVKEGTTPQQAFANQIAKQREAAESHPATFAYRKALHDLTGMGNRWKLHAAVELMPDDPDGVWSEACDSYGDNVSADIDDVVKLCRLFKLAVAETKTTA